MGAITQLKIWNNGEPVWNKGITMKPPLECLCSQCGIPISIPSGSGPMRNRRYRLRKGFPIYCSMECRKIGRGAKISQSQKGRPGYKPSPEGLARRIAANLGRVPWNKGKHWSAEHQAIRCAALRKSEKLKVHLDFLHAKFRGSQSPHWKGGITPENKVARGSLQCRMWRRRVFKRDNYTCQICGNRGGELHADHIKPFSLHPELRWELTNGRTLCITCHRETPTYGRMRKNHG